MSGKYKTKLGELGGLTLTTIQIAVGDKRVLVICRCKPTLKIKYTFAEGEKRVLVINRCKPTLKIKYTFAEGKKKCW